MSVELHTWSDRLESAIASARISTLDRVMIVASTGSTQDLALRACGGSPGLIVAAGTQTRGRGRFGRSWVQAGAGGLAMTMVLDAAQHAGVSLPLRLGVGVARAIEGVLGEPVGLRWPNDLVEVGPGARKLAGVLIDQRQGLLAVGVGVNVAQGDTDWPAELRSRAASLAQLGARVERIEVAQRLLVEVDAALREGIGPVLTAWRQRDVLVGTRRVFVLGNETITGEVLGIEPTSEIRLRTNAGVIRTLDARRTSLGDDRCDES